MTKKIGHIKKNCDLTIPECNIESKEIGFSRKERLHLNKEKYNIDFVINMIKTLIDQIDRHKLNPNDLAFSLTHSLKRLLGNLEVEKDQLNKKDDL
jgi:hypothetical protein